jgi:hypothetical protein
MVRRSLIVVLASALAAVPVSSASAATKPGWSLAKASAYIEFNLRIPVPEVVAYSKEFLRLQKQLGGQFGIAEAEEEIELAKAGLGVDRASCLGLKAAPGGYVSFKCKLAMSDDLGFTAKVLGTWKRLPTGKWRWDSSSFTLGGLCPPRWDGSPTSGLTCR